MSMAEISCPPKLLEYQTASVCRCMENPFVGQAFPELAGDDAVEIRIISTTGHACAELRGGYHVGYAWIGDKGSLTE